MNQLDLAIGIKKLDFKNDIIKDFPQQYKDFIKEFYDVSNIINGNQIIITTYIINGESYFKGKDILKHLEYNIKRCNICAKFKEIRNQDESFCVKLGQILFMIGIDPYMQNLNKEIHLNLKEYFLSKKGLYYLILNSRKKESNIYRIFIYSEFLSKIEKDIKDKLL